MPARTLTRDLGFKAGAKSRRCKSTFPIRRKVSGVFLRTNFKTNPTVNNAGYVLGTERIGKVSSDDMEGMFNTNVFGLINMTQALINEMKSRNAGHVINIGSVAGREPYIGGSIYCATKHAVRAFTGALLRELVETQIRVTEIQPGMVETEFSLVRFRGDKEAANRVYNGFTPLTASDIAEEIVWAASRPPHVNIAEVLVMPTDQATPWLIHKGEKIN